MPNTSGFLLELIFATYIAVLLFRVMLQWVRADFFNPISQFVYKVTQPLVRFPAAVLPNWRLNVAALLLAYGFQVLLLWLKAETEVVSNGVSTTDWAPMCLAALFMLFIDWIGLIFWLLLGYAILSWVPQLQYQPIGRVLTKICTPLVALVRSRMPDMGGIDISVFVVAILFMLLRVILTDMHLAIDAALFRVQG